MVDWIELNGGLVFVFEISKRLTAMSLRPSVLLPFLLLLLDEVWTDFWYILLYLADANSMI